MAEKFAIGAAMVEWGDATPEIIDSTKGGVQIKVTSNWKDLTNDQNGDTPYDSVFKGRILEVIVPLTESEDVAKIQKFTHNSTLVTDSVEPSREKVEVYANAGSTLRANAQKLVIKPIGKTENEWVTVPLAAPKTDLEWVYDSDNERLLAAKFIGFADDAGLLYIIGDETATA